MQLAPSPPSERPAPYIRLREWLLELSCELLDPRAVDAALDAALGREGILLSFSDSMRVLHRIDSAGNAFGSAVNTSTHAIGNWHSANIDQFARLPSNGSVAAAVVRKMDSSPDLEWGDALQLDSSAAQRFAYFEGRVARLQVADDVPPEQDFRSCVCETADLTAGSAVAGVADLARGQRRAVPDAQGADPGLHGRAGTGAFPAHRGTHGSSHARWRPAAHYD